MSDYINYYGRNAPPTGDWDWGGYSYLGPIMIPPIPVTVGMTDRAGSGVVYYLMWDGDEHILLTDEPPLPFPQSTQEFGVSTPYGQNVIVYGPYDGPYLGTTGWRLGVSTAAQGGPFEGAPRLQFDWLGPQDSGVGYTASGPPVVAPDVNGPQTQSYPEPSNYPAPGVPTVPGIPSSTPVPTGGGFAAFEAAWETNTPPLIGVAQVTSDYPAQPWHLQHYGG